MPGGRSIAARRKDRREIVLDPDRHAWLQQSREPDTAYAAFVRYRDGGLPRPTLQAFSELHPDLTAKTSTIRTWSYTHAWTYRLRAYDDHVASQVCTAVVQAHSAQAEIVATRVVEHGRKLHDLAAHELDKLLRLSRNSDELVVTPKTLLQIITLAMTMDRTLTEANSPDDDTRKAIDLTELDDLDLKALQRMASKIEKGRTA